MALCSLSTGSTATPRAPRGVHHERAGHDENFLVGERDRLSGVDRGEHGIERRCAGRREQHDVDVGMRGDRNQPLGSAERRDGTRARGRCSSAAYRGERVSGRHRDRLGRETARPARRTASDVLAGRQRHDAQPIGMRGDNGQRALPDRAGRAENGDASGVFI